jgi:hypothetical protein
MLSEEEKSEMAKSDPIDYHFSLGMLLQRDVSFVTCQVRMAAAVCTFLMKCLVVLWELFNFAA